MQQQNQSLTNGHTTMSMDSFGNLTQKCSTPGCSKHLSNPELLILSGEVGKSYFRKLQNSPEWHLVTEKKPNVDSLQPSERDITLVDGSLYDQLIAGGAIPVSAEELPQIQKEMMRALPDGPVAKKLPSRPKGRPRKVVDVKLPNGNENSSERSSPSEG